MKFHFIEKREDTQILEYPLCVCIYDCNLILFIDLVSESLNATLSEV